MFEARINYLCQDPHSGGLSVRLINNQLEDEAGQEDQDSVGSCWPFVCASAKKAVHKGLNIDKMTSKPVIRVGEKKQESPGWLSWLFGFELSRSDDEDVSEEEGEEEALNDDEVDEEEDLSELEQLEDDDYRSELL